jgi:hypothetical protein
MPYEEQILQFSAGKEAEYQAVVQELLATDDFVFVPDTPARIGREDLYK